MAFFKRDKDSVEEFRRGRESLRSLTGPGEGAPLSPAEHAEVDEPPRAPSPQAKADNLDKYRQGATMVAKDSSFSGMLKSNSHLFIEGEFEGELEARETIVVADGARVKADVRAMDVIIAGTLDGKVQARGRFHAMPTSHVTGEIQSAVLVVDQGSEINCRFAMQPRKEKPRP